jgi:tetratricopeptide (TPR) repeat protein
VVALFLVFTLAQAAGGVEAIYMKGLADARAAFEKGAPPESLAPVREAIAALLKISQERPGQAEIARLTLQAAAAGAQSERDEMALYLDQATRMEVLQRDARQPGAPGVSALEVAGDLWLQVFRYDEAIKAYERAAQYLGETPRIRDSLARARARLTAVTPR